VHIGATAFLGVQLSADAGFQGGAASAGVSIVGVESRAAAARAGMTAGDEIVSVAGHPVASSSDIQSALQGHHPGDRISISWPGTSGQDHTASVVLATGPVG